MKITAFAPASIANVGAGFDVLGVALDSPGDTVTVTKVKEKHFSFHVETVLANVPVTEDKNIAAYVAKLMMEELKCDFGIEMILHKNMPVGSGIGSSGASVVASLFAVNALLQNPLSKKELLRFAIEGERKASGAAHGDNVAPALFGGACIIRNEKPLDVISFHIHPSITWIVLSPHVSLTTAKARSVLPHVVPLQDVTRQMGNMGGLLIGLMEGNADIIRHCMVDHIAEPKRRSLIPAFSEVKEAAIKAGALAAGISGSGPAIFAVTLSKERAAFIANAMIKAMQGSGGYEADVFVSQTNLTGARIVSKC